MPAPDTATLHALLERGLVAHRAGRLVDAIATYEAVLARAPQHFDALHMLGVAAVQSGAAERGAAAIEAAIAIGPDVAAAHVNLAMAQSALGRPLAALASAEQALALDPASADAHANRGNALLALDRPAEALAAYDRALALRPADAQGRYNRGNALRDLGRLDEAAASYDAAISLAPSFVEALTNLGAVQVRLGRLEDALSSYEAAVAAQPGAPALLNRAAALSRLRRPLEALAGYAAALAADPANAAGHNGRASVLNDLGRASEALGAAEQALAIDAELADAHNNRGIALYAQGQLDDALASYDAALARQPQSPEAHYNRALAALRAGDLAAGFAEYRWRWQVGEAARERPALACPEWNGDDPAGKRLLVFAEQGFGDSLQFVRYLPAIAAQGAQVTLLVEPALVSLLRRSLPGIEVVESLPAGARYDLQAAMLCLPRLAGTTLATVPSATPYLAADPAAAAAWAERLAGRHGRKVGLVWAGAARRHNPVAAAIDARRSLRLDQLAPLAAVADVAFVSLQLGEPAGEARRPPAGLQLADWTGELRDFADTAALVAGLDLVISVDTAVAHLAGALGRPVWILSRFDGCWRWLTGREDSPWYPTARLFHQPAPGAWDEVIAAVAAALRSSGPGSTQRAAASGAVSPVSAAPRRDSSL